MFAALPAEIVNLKILASPETLVSLAGKDGQLLGVS